MVPDVRRHPLPVKPADPVLLPPSCSWVHLPDAGLLLLVTGLLLPLSRDWPALPADARAADAKELLLLLADSGPLVMAAAHRSNVWSGMSSGL